MKKEKERSEEQRRTPGVIQRVVAWLSRPRRFAETKSCGCYAFGVRQRAVWGRGTNTTSTLAPCDEHARWYWEEARRRGGKMSG